MRELRVMKQRATGLLVAMTVFFLVVTVFDGDAGWVGYLRATAEASMVGGLADWFAVTALFRHPLGIPIPHTAVIRARKDQFGETLGDFVQQNFLTPEVIGDRVRGADVPARAAEWLSHPANAENVADHVIDIAIALVDIVRDEDVHRLLEDEAGRALDALPLAPLAGRALRLMTEQGRHQDVLDAVLRGLERFLEESRPNLRDRFGEQSPWWLPEAVEDRIFDRLLDGVRNLLHDVNANPDHELRAQFNQWAGEMIERWETSPELLSRGDQLKHELRNHPALRAWTTSLWADVKTRLRDQADQPDSELRRRLASAVATAGRRLADDPALREKADEIVEAGVRYVSEHFRDEIHKMVSGTIARWDADETSRKLELLLGRDLQFIRINGTVVGGLAGVVIHATGHALG